MGLTMDSKNTLKLTEYIPLWWKIVHTFREMFKKQAKNNGWTVAYLGRVRELESFHWLIKAIELIPVDQRPDLKIAGDGVAADAVHKLLLTEANRLGIHLHLSAAFEVNDLPELMADVDVMYAMYEPQRGNIMQGALPVKMFDAASFGVPYRGEFRLLNGRNLQFRGTWDAGNMGER